MKFEEIGKFLNRALLLSLDRINGPSLVRVVYLLGLAVAVVWGLNHFFLTFRTGFGDGLWGLVEIVVFGLFGLTVLRMVCEALIVFFVANKDAVRTASKTQAQTNLIDEVRDAIEQLGEEEKDKKPVAKIAAAKPAKSSAPAKTAKTAKAPARSAKPARRTPRTAKRTPKPKAGTGEG
jgi:hypothetical protein